MKDFFRNISKHKGLHLAYTFFLQNILDLSQLFLLLFLKLENIFQEHNLKGDLACLWFLLFQKKIFWNFQYMLENYMICLSENSGFLYFSFALVPMLKANHYYIKKNKNFERFKIKILTNYNLLLKYIYL